MNVRRDGEPVDVVVEVEYRVSGLLGTDVLAYREEERERTGDNGTAIFDDYHPEGDVDMSVETEFGPLRKTLEPGENEVTVRLD